MPWWVPRARVRYLLQIVLDAMASVVSLLLGMALRFEFHIPMSDLRRAVPILVLAAFVQFVTRRASGASTSVAGGSAASRRSPRWPARWWPRPS